MPKQPLKEEIEWTLGDQNLWIYGGWFDIANSAEGWDTILALTKLYALFYERIIVFDGYFNCHGPLFSALHHAALSSDGNSISGWPEETFTEHEILKLIYEGIVVPAHREGASMRDTFKNARRGIVPGEYLCVKKAEGESVLEMVDEVARFYYHQPEEILGPSTTAFHTSLWNSLLHPDTLIGQVFQTPHLIETCGSLQRDLIIKIRSIVDDFQDQLYEAKGNSAFRRGWVEHWAAKTLNIRLQNYSSFSDRVNYSSPYSTVEESVVLEILNSVSTAYELMHARAFRCQAGLFSFHDRDIPELEIMRNTTTALPSNGPQTQRNIQVDALKPFESLSAQDVVEFRQRDAFKRYCEEVRGLRMPSEGESLLEANPRFERFFFGKYITELVEFLRGRPKERLLPKILLTAGGLGSSFALYSSAFDCEGLEIMGISVSTILRGLAIGAGATGALGASGQLSDVIEGTQVRRSVARFRRNNYSLMETQVPSDN